jgi:hypothetical protein
LPNRDVKVREMGKRPTRRGYLLAASFLAAIAIVGSALGATRTRPNDYLLVLGKRAGPYHYLAQPRRGVGTSRLPFQLSARQRASAAATKAFAA